MMNLGGITHKNEIIDQKAKVVYDYFHYFLSENEYLSLQNQPLDNHISILQKIDFRLANTNLEPSSRIVITRLMDNDLFNLKTDIISRKGKVKTIINKIKRNNTCKNIDLLLIKANVKEAVIILNGSYDFDNTEYLELCVDNIIFYLSCGCEYSKHKKEIIYFTKLIASEFLRLGFSIKELTGVNGVFNRLLSKEIKIDQKTENLHSRFPLAPDIERQRGEKHFKKIVEDFLENRTLKEQFKGIENYVKKDSLEYIFIVRVKNASGFEGLNISYKNIKIVSSVHITAVGEGLGEEQKDRLRSFIKPKNCIYFKIPKHKSFDAAVHLAFKEAENTLSYLSYPKLLRGEIDKSDIIRIYNNNLGWIWKRESLVVFNDRKYDLDNLELNLKLNNELTGLDTLYFRSFTSKLLEDKVLNAWRYLEMLGRYGGFNKDGERIKNLPFILLFSEQNYSKLHLENLIINLIINNRDVVNCRIPYLEMDDVLRDQTNCIKTLKDNTNYYFTNELISDFENIDLNYKRRYTSYKESLELLYEQRNFIIHQASICSLSANQSLNVIQILLTRMRKTIIADIKENSRNELKNSIKYLIREGKDLMA